MPRIDLRHLAESAANAAGLDQEAIDILPDGIFVTGVEHDSRRVGSGTLFCCLRGRTADGHQFARAARDAGATALLVDHQLDLGLPELVVADPRRAMPHLAATFHGHPSRHLDIVGVTGTNGKTTTVHLVAEILRHLGRTAEVIGTLTGVRTTPESTELQAQLAEFVERGVDAVAMEVSSHALDQRRVDAVWFRVGIFTNLSRDHLDYHATMEEYFRAKARLFEVDRIELAVIDIDTPHGRLLADTVAMPVRRVTLDDVVDIEVGLASSRCRWQDVELRVPLGGRFNLRNALVAAEAVLALGGDPAAIADGLAAAGPVPGRFEPVDAGQPFGVVVDYAHTPDGIEKLLTAAREVTGGRVIIVFGCGGDRDATKRPLMGSAAEEGADIVVVTSDNPRSEDPFAIIEAIVDGLEQPPHLVEPDRRAAIAAAVALAQPGDLLVIAGKGHETTQTIGHQVHPFDDRAVVAELIDASRGPRGWSHSPASEDEAP